MSTSIAGIQRDIILRRLGSIREGEWKILVCDRESTHLLDTIATRDEVLGGIYTELTLIEENRLKDPVTTAVYFLTPRPYVVEWLKADVNRRRYKEVFLVWTSSPRQDIRAIIKIGDQEYVKSSSVLNVEYTSQESNLINFVQSDSLQILFNPHCEELIQRHLHELTQKIIAICIALGEYPLVRFYRPPVSNSQHRAAELCAHLAKFVQDGLDSYAASSNGAFLPPPSQPRTTLLITDRTMDLMAPCVHELTYQAMAMDLLPIREEDGEVTYPHQTRDDKQQPVTERKDLNDKDKLWVSHRHLHMKDLLIKLSGDFKKFQAQNSQFADTDDQHISVNTIKDMLAGLPQFQQDKSAFSLHIDMAEKCAKIFQDQKLLDVTSLEQSLATGLDEENQRPKNITDQLVRILADESVILESRARLLVMYIMYRGGILEGDTTKLLHHGELPSLYRNTIVNLQSLGAKVSRTLGDNTNQYKPLYPAPEVKYAPGQEVSLSRFEPMLRYALEEIIDGDPRVLKNKFPSTTPDADDQNQRAVAQTSLRSAGKPKWATSDRPTPNKARQRIIVFMAGGATYSEARVCYDVARARNKEIFLATTQMLTPKGFLNETGRLHQSRRNLALSIDKRPPEKPQWMQEPPPEAARPQQPGPQRSNQSSSRPPTEAMQNMNLGAPKPQNGSSRPGTAQTPTPPTSAGSFSTQMDSSSGKLKKEKKDKDGGFFKRLKKH